LTETPGKFSSARGKTSLSGARLTGTKGSFYDFCRSEQIHRPFRGRTSPYFGLMQAPLPYIAKNLRHPKTDAAGKAAYV